MMMQSGDGPTIFSAETNPYLRQREGDTFSIFGKKIKKKSVTDVLGRLAGKKKSAGEMQGMDGAEAAEGIDILSSLAGGEGNAIASMMGAPEFADLGGGLGVKAKRASAPVYDPAQIYGGFLSMYGGKKVRGGLLGE